MEKFVWQESCSVHHEKLDSQHKQLFEIINSLQETLLTGSDRDMQENTWAALNAFIEYADEHFATEEGYMRDINFPGLEKHTAQHADFLEQILQYRSKSQQGKPISNARLLVDLTLWLHDHILNADQEYCRFK